MENIGIGDLSLDERKRIFNSPKNKEEFLVLASWAETTWKESIDNWAPVVTVIKEQNRLVSEFLEKQGQSLKITKGELMDSINYTVIAKDRGKPKEIHSRQNWVNDELRDQQLKNCWQDELVDSLNLSVFEWHKRTKQIGDETVEYREFELPSGYLMATSDKMAKQIGIKGDFTLFPQSYDRALVGVKYFKNFIDRLLKKPDVRINQE